jgi:hypothetical protein
MLAWDVASVVEAASTGVSVLTLLLVLAASGNDSCVVVACVSWAGAGVGSTKLACPTLELAALLVCPYVNKTGFNGLTPCPSMGLLASAFTVTHPANITLSRQTLVVVTVAFIGICSVFVMIIIISEQILTLLIKSCYSYHSANVQLMRYEKIAY